jgi:hypothetical protein
MRTARWLGPAALGVSIVIGATPAHATRRAGEEKQPVALAGRPLTLPEMTLSPEAGGLFVRLPPVGSQAISFGAAGVGVSFGISDDFEVNATPVRLLFGGGSVRYDYPSIGLSGRYSDGDVEVGTRFKFFIPTQVAVFATAAGIPVAIHAAGEVRIDTGINVTGVFGEGGGLAGLFGPGRQIVDLDAGVPLEVTVSPIEPFSFGLRTGFGIATFEEPKTIFLPLGFMLAGSIPGDDGPIGDLIARFDFPTFLLPASDGEKIFPDAFVVGGVARFYLYL